MENQAAPELPVEMPPEDVESVEPQVYQQKTPLFVPVIAVLFTLVIVGIVIAIAVNSGRKTRTGKSQPQVTPVAATPSPATHASPTPVLVNIPTTYLPLILEVSAVGGGAMGERREYTVDLKLQKGDKLNVIKADEKDLINFPNYSKGATDKGLRIEHGKAYLDIVPVFEGVGFPLLNKPGKVAVINKNISAQPLYRLNLAELQSNFTLSENRGYTYTTQYIEGVKNCSIFEPDSGKKFPACIGGGLDVQPVKSGPVSIVCHAENTDIGWCDAVVASLSITGTSPKDPPASK